jgi:hypothetical protein
MIAMSVTAEQIFANSQAQIETSEDQTGKVFCTAAGVLGVLSFLAGIAEGHKVDAGRRVPIDFARIVNRGLNSNVAAARLRMHSMRHTGLLMFM